MIQDKGNNNDFYFEYHRIGSTAFRNKVRFYENNKTKIHNLTYEERIDVDLDYILCLFEIGKYHKYLSKADHLIEIVIIDNIFDYNGLNIYNDLLFKKAACLYNTGQYNKSEKVLKEIVKLDIKNGIARALFIKCKKKQSRNWYETIKTFAIIMFISTVFLTILEPLVIKSLFSDALSTFSILKYTSFSLGMVALIGNEIYLRYIIGKEIGFTISF